MLANFLFAYFHGGFPLVQILPILCQVSLRSTTFDFFKRCDDFAVLHLPVFNGNMAHLQAASSLYDNQLSHFVFFPFRVKIVGLARFHKTHADNFCHLFHSSVSILYSLTSRKSLFSAYFQFMPPI